MTTTQRILARLTRASSLNPEIPIGVLLTTSGILLEERRPRGAASEMRKFLDPSGDSPEDILRRMEIDDDGNYAPF